jgi:hypothetical protein
MNLKIPSKYSSFCKAQALTLLFLVCEIGALLISCFLIIAIAYIGASIGAYQYHQIPLERRIEIGQNFLPGDNSLLYVLFSPVLSLPLAMLAHVYIFKKFLLEIPSKYSSFFKKLVQLALFVICEICALYISFVITTVLSAFIDVVSNVDATLTFGLFLSLLIAVPGHIFISRKFFRWVEKNER